MTHRERFFATIANLPVDKPASWLGLPVPSANKALFDYFHVTSIDELKLKIDDDIYPIEVPYNFPPSNHIACAFNFAKNAHLDTPDERTLTESGFFEGMSDPALIETFNWPNPAEYIDVEESKRKVMSISPEYVRMGIMWSAHFQDACAAFGMEDALMTMMTEPDMFQAVIDRITEFYLEANAIFYEATKGYLDAVLIGNDFGSQTGLIISPEDIRHFVLQGTKKLIDQAKSYGLVVVHHSCGSIFPIIDDLIQIGVDVIHPIQALAKDMDATNLKENFAGKTAFCGGVDAQYLLVNGKPDEIDKKVRELKELFPTGLVISPSHEAILIDIAPANIESLFNAINS